MPSRFAYERAVRDSELPPPTRHLALTLATWADVTTGIIPDEYMPSLTRLARATGLDRSTVRRHLDRLEAEGWVERHRPSVAEARRQKKRTRYRLLIPIGDDQADAELGAQNTGTRGTAPPTVEELGAQRPQVGGTQPPELGAQNTGTRGTAPLSSSKFPEVPYQSPRAGARATTTGKPSITEQLDAAAGAACAELGRRVGRPITPRWGRRVAMHILDSSRGVVDDPARYVAAVITRERDISRFLPTPTPSGKGAEEAFADADQDAPAPSGRPTLTVHQGGAEADDDVAASYRPDARAHAARARELLARGRKTAD